ncbi:MAG: YebC/PmpR family DNA-binding transcriptional regulator, partial [Candidatus Aminicenantes bacterium]|nr:YebC/PmpR family DNA-binding transcriptional regulator [Candidatus Aminicenantes bacterium]
GELEGVNYEDISYEGYGPGGVAILIECLTDNKNRTVAEVRHTLGKYNGNLGESGCVGWMFTKKGLILIEKDKIEEDELLEIVLENGAEDMTDDDDNFAVTTTTETLAQVTDAIKAKIEIISSELSMIPSTYIKLEEKQAHQMLKLLDKLEEIDDIQNVWTNFDIDPEIIESFPG